MKHTIIIALSIFANLFQANAQSEEYLESMKETVTSIQTAAWGTDLQPFANQMERIASAEPKEWLPQYWAAFCYLNISYAEKTVEKKDLILDKADKFVAAAEALSANNDEIEVLKANLASARVAADPMSRWQKYGALSTAALEKATTLNAANPRIYLHQATGIFFTPEAYGGGKKNALPLIKTAIEHYEKFKPTSEIMPNWGLTTAQYLLAEAEKEG
jgi:hypothetical protein